MKNLKFIIGFASCGFFLSLFFGFFSHSGFLRLFLRASVSFIFFALLGVLIQIIFDKLLDLNDGMGSDDYSAGNSEGETSAEYVSSAAKSKDKPGSHVDVIIQDDDLPAGDSDNKFVVGENRQMLNESDVASSNTKGSENNKDLEPKKFVPMQFKQVQDNNTKDLSNSSGSVEAENQAALGGMPETAPVANSAAKSVSKSSVASDNTAQNETVSPLSGKTGGNFTESKNDVDVLPDMNDISFSTNEQRNAEEDEDDLSDSSFSDSPVATSSGKKGGEIEIKDASLMAKAISSILSGEA